MTYYLINSLFKSMGKMYWRTVLESCFHLYAVCSSLICYLVAILLYLFWLIKNWSIYFKTNEIQSKYISINCRYLQSLMMHTIMWVSTQKMLFFQKELSSFSYNTVLRFSLLFCFIISDFKFVGWGVSKPKVCKKCKSNN